MRRTVVTFARNPFPNAKLLPWFSETHPAPKTFFFLAASLVKVKKLQPLQGKLVGRPEVDGSDLCMADSG